MKLGMHTNKCEREMHVPDNLYGIFVGKYFILQQKKNLDEV